MQVSNTLRRKVKELTIAAGAYRPARRLYRRLNRTKYRTHLNDTRFYGSLLPRSALSFDVGANIGDKSEALIEAGSRVVAFEPNPLLHGELLSRFKGERNWTVVLAAVGGEPGVLPFYAREIPLLSSLDVEGVQEWQAPLIGTYHVPVVTLDMAIQTFGVPFFCKVDVEGWEYEVLKGLATPIPVVSLEYHLNHKGVQRVRDCLQRLKLLGASSVNVTPAETPVFLFERWMELDRFLEWFPGDLEQKLGGDVYGDMLIRNDRST